MQHALQRRSLVNIPRNKKKTRHIYFYVFIHIHIGRYTRVGNPSLKNVAHTHSARASESALRSYTGAVYSSVRGVYVPPQPDAKPFSYLHLAESAIYSERACRALDERQQTPWTGARVPRRLITLAIDRCIMVAASEGRHSRGRAVGYRYFGK